MSTSITPVITVTEPIPISQIVNSGLRDSIQKAIEGVDPGHGNALLNVTNKGVGVLAVHRFDDHWALVAGARYTFGGGPEVQVTVAGSW